MCHFPNQEAILREHWCQLRLHPTAEDPALREGTGECTNIDLLKGLSHTTAPTSGYNSLWRIKNAVLLRYTTLLLTRLLKLSRWWTQQKETLILSSEETTSIFTLERFEKVCIFLRWSISSHLSSYIHIGWLNCTLKIPSVYTGDLNKYSLNAISTFAQKSKYIFHSWPSYVDF